MRTSFAPFCLITLFAAAVIAQPSNSATFGHRIDAMGSIQSVIDGEGNAIDLYDISGGANPAASHFNEAYAVPLEWQHWTGGVDKYAMDFSFKTIEYPGPIGSDNEKRSWYWIDGVSRILVDKGFENGFSMRINFNGGYQTLRKSWQDGYAPLPNEIRHNYAAATLDWDEISRRAVTTGAASITPIGEFYGSFHTKFGLSLGAGGGYGFSEFEDMYFASGWKTSMKGYVAAHRISLGARYTYPDLSDYFAVGFNYGISGGSVNNEKDDDYEAYVGDDNSLGFQAEFGYPKFVRGAVGFGSKTMNEDYFSSATDTIADSFEDKLSSVDFKLKLTGEGLKVPVNVGIDMSNWSTSGENTASEIEIDGSSVAFGISTVPVAEMLTFAAQYELGENNYESVTAGSSASMESNRISFGTEIYPVREFGVRLGFEIFERVPDSDYESLFGGYVLPYIGPLGRLDFVPEIEKGNALTGGLALRLDEGRLLIEISGKHYFTSDPQIYKDNSANSDEAFFGLTYYLK